MGRTRRARSAPALGLVAAFACGDSGGGDLGDGGVGPPDGGRLEDVGLTISERGFAFGTVVIGPGAETDFEICNPSGRAVRIVVARSDGVGALDEAGGPEGPAFGVGFVGGGAMPVWWAAPGSSARTPERSRCRRPLDA